MLCYVKYVSNKKQQIANSEIEDEEVARSMKHQFELLWKIAKE